MEKLTISNASSLPSARPGNALYFANARSLFYGNIGAYQELERRILSLDSYGGRLVPLVGMLWEGDCHLILERLPAASLMTYYKEVLDLKLPELHVNAEMEAITPELRTLAEGLDGYLDGLTMNKDIANIATETGNKLSSSEHGCRLGNDKHALHHFLESEGLATFDSYDVKDNEELKKAAKKLMKKGYRYAVAKSAVGASGVGLVKFSTYRPPEIADYMFESAPCLVQGWLDDSIGRIREVVSPSVQFLITDGKLTFYDVTDQILGIESVHEGNVSPPISYDDPAITEEFMRQAEIVCSWLHENGYRGLGSVDYHLAITENDGFEVRICEVNARVTGASYPSYLAKKFHPRGVWWMQNFRYTEQMRCSKALQGLEAAGLLFKPGMTQGVIPINFNLTADNLVNKGQFLFLGDDVETVKHLTREVVEHAHLVGARS